MYVCDDCQRSWRDAEDAFMHALASRHHVRMHGPKVPVAFLMVRNYCPLIGSDADRT